MRRHAAALLAGVLATIAAPALVASPAAAAEPGVEVRITEVPDEFTAGDDARTLTAVVSTDRDGGCRKVRWSLLLQVQGAGLDQVRVDRVEDDGSFPLQVEADGDAARLTDQQLDPGRLCRDSTVTARYRVAFAGDAEQGEVAFQAQAFDQNGRLLQEAGATSRINGEKAEPSPSPSESPSAEEAVPIGEESAADAVPPPADLSATPAAGSQASLLGPGLIIGSLLVFAGVGLLLRLRMRNRGKPGRAPQRRQHSYPY